MAKTILIIDDNQTERVHLKKILNGLGFDSIEAVNGKEGVDMAEKQSPSLILMDNIMPELSGSGATRAIKKNPTTSGIPVVMISSKNRDPDKENAKENGAVAYIVKPATKDDLIEILAKFLP